MYDTPEEVLRACVDRLGGAKSVGCRMKPDLAPLPYLRTASEKSEAAKFQLLRKLQVAEENRRDQQRTDAMLRGNAARLGVVEGEG